MKTVAFVCSVHGYSGDAVHVKELQRAFAAEGVRVLGLSNVTRRPYEISLSDSKASLKSWVVQVFPRELLRLFSNYLYWRRMRRIVCRQHIDLIYERYTPFGFAGILAARLARCPHVLEVNASLVKEVKGYRSRFWMNMLGLATFERWILRQAGIVLTVTEALKQQLIENGVPEHKVVVTQNAVDTAAFHPGVDGTEIAQRYGLVGKQVLGFVGGMAGWHRVDLLVEAFAAIAPRFPDARLLLVGDGEKRMALEEQVRANRLSDRIFFTGGIGHEKVAAHIQAMSICYMPHSNPYGSPIKIFEYMAMGKPVIAPRLPPIAEVITHEETGILFEPENLEGLVTATARLLENPELSEVIGQNGRELVSTRHTWRHNARRVMEIVEQKSDATGLSTS